MAVGYLLHSRPYRESSSLQVFFTDSDGRVDVMSRLTRRRGKPTMAAGSTPFTLCELSWRGTRDLKALQYCEAAAPSHVLSGRYLFCGLYVNELLYRLLPKQVPEPALFPVYAGVLAALAEGQNQESCLRQFEMQLLTCLGYGLVLDRDVQGLRVDADAWYQYWPEHGLVLLDAAEEQAVGVTAKGCVFLAIHNLCFEDDITKRTAKQLMRAALAPLLGSRPLHSRSLFR